MVEFIESLDKSILAVVREFYPYFTGPELRVELERLRQIEQEHDSQDEEEKVISRYKIRNALKCQPFLCTLEEISRELAGDHIPTGAWERAYMALSDAAGHLDAMNARVKLNETEPEHTL